MFNREQIAEREGMNAEDMVLIYGISTMEDSQDLSEYGIQDGKSFSFQMNALQNQQ